MAGNVSDTSGDILVEFDYNNIIVVDPNKTIKDKVISERLVDHEKLVMFVNLEAEVLPRTKLAVGGSPEDRIRLVSVAKMNFLRPTEGPNLTTGYYDELTGKDSRNMLGDNQMKQEILDPKDGTGPYQKISLNNPGKTATDNGLLGIKSINVTTNSSFIPSVKITLEDIQGRALFQLGDNSPYSAFFNLPYCPFYLTMKGFYGQAIRYQLNLEKFNARFNTFSGNYEIDLEFHGYKFNILNEISMAHLLAAPHMYSTTFDVSKSITSPEGGTNKNIEAQGKQELGASKNSTISSSNVVEQIVSEKGYQKVVELYSEYKSKGLIAPDFPEITFAQLMVSLDNFEKNVINSYTKVDVEPLTNIRQYKEVLKNYYNTIRGSQNSWFNLNLDPKPIILKTGEKVYNFKQSIIDDPTTRESQKSLLSGYTIAYNEKLLANPTLGVGGPAPIKISISYDTFFKSITLNDIDFVQTTTSRTGVIAPTEAQVLTEKNKLIGTLKFVSEKDASDTRTSIGEIFIPPVFIFEGDGKVNGQIARFDALIAEIEAQANKKLGEYETLITAEFTRKVEDAATGIGFKPTVRNICAVIMASTEAFIRLLDDVHTNAWNVKYDPIRQLSILQNPSSAQGSDNIDYVSKSQQANNENQGLSTSQIPVYPWPQFFVETPLDKTGRFQLKYIADPSVVNVTNGYNYAVWPEVEFVEEYMRGLTQKFNPPASQPPIDAQNTTNIINVNAIEYPTSGIAYVNKEETKFFYEIWERQYLTSNYSNFVRGSGNQLQQISDLVISSETQNILSSLNVSSPFLTFKLKNYPIDAQNYVPTLESFSNQGTGRLYQEFIRDFYVTPYIRTITESSFNILGLNNIGLESQKNVKSEALLQLVKNAPNQPNIFDTFPFTDPSWVANNMATSQNSVGENVYDTKKVLTVFQPRNVISNFENIYDFSKNRPVTNFCYNKTNNPTSEIQFIGLNAFYDVRKNPTNFIPTEGYTNYSRPFLTSNVETTTSMLNTPYFVNAILNGVSSWRSNDPYPYTQAAYLFINSLPLATLRERYKDNLSTSTNTSPLVNVGNTDLDYIASCFKKFGAIHKVPYAWVLKLGSIWYRYKTYKKTGTDILKSAWTDFDYRTNYDPITKLDTLTYSFEFEGKKQITLQKSGNSINSIQTGFYPKVINDFNVFYNGYDLYKTYSDSEIQASIDGGMKVFNFKDSNINVFDTVLSLNTTYDVQTWSVVLPNGLADLNDNSAACNPSNNTTSGDYYIVPSFGTSFNQTKSECFVNSLPICPILNNPSIYNGSVRLLWTASNYGYFNSNQLVIPPPDSYVNKITSTQEQQAAFKFLTIDEYSKIEEIFSVFETKILDIFEQEFLNFSKPVANIDLGPQLIVPIGANPTDGNAQFRNFQLLFRNLMQVPAPNSTLKTEVYFDNLGVSQLTNFMATIKSFMEYDVILKNGNPSGYRRRIFDSFIVQEGGANTIVDPIVFEPYVKNSLPSRTSSITLAQSRIDYPNEWTTLELQVGFSTIENLAYSDNGSYITDFFIDNNIKFSVDNIVLCEPLIKMYATQKLYTPTLNNTQFVNLLQNYFAETNQFQNTLLNGILSRLRKDLPDQQQLPERTIQSVMDGQQGKVESYEIFKALNDKWVAGGDFKNKTLFEDMLFLDRASRNIGDVIIIDIFDLKNILNENSLNMEMSVFTFMSGLLIRNKFNVMPLPAYVNFYNVQDADGTTISQNTEGSLEFANNMWGTFLGVDYRKSGPKLVCFYAGLPSSYLALPKGNSRFRDDAFDLRRSSDNPLIEDQSDKKDWAISNKCVGFNVDVGTRNQGVFYSVAVGMDAGKATSESIQTTLNIVNQANGRNVATQNVGLYNFYKQRSYTCKVSCLGNALIQPTMYFNLRHVPIFNGPYLITEITHQITPGQFQTSFTGTRQGIYDLPTIDNYLQGLNQNVLSKIEAIIKNSKDPVIVTGTTDIDKVALLQQTGNSTAAAQNSCTNSLVEPYLTWGNFVTSQTTSVTRQEFVNVLKTKTNDANLQVLIYMICYITNYKENKFYGYNNNYGNIELTTNWGSSTKYFIQQQASCVNSEGANVKNVSRPMANFTSIETFMEFMVSRLSSRVKQVFFAPDNLGIEKFFSCYWPKDNGTSTLFDSKFPTGYETLRKTVKSAFKSAGDTGLNVNAVGKAIESTKESTTKIKNNQSGKTPASNNLNTSTTVVVSCPPPTVTSFSPLTGSTGTILNIFGTNLDTVTAVTINNVLVKTGITINNQNNIIVIVPTSITQVPQSNFVVVRTKNGVGSSTTNFTYNPNQVTPVQSTVPGAPPNVNTQPQQTGPIVLTASTSYNLVGSATNMRVGINPDAGPWDIIKQYTEWTWKAVKLVAGPNNTFVEQVVGKGDYSRQLEDYVSTNKQSFNISDLDILNIVKEEIDDVKEFNKINRIYNKISLLAVSPNKYVKYNTTSNPKDVIPDANQTFPFTIKLT